MRGQDYAGESAGVMNLFARLFGEKFKSIQTEDLRAEHLRALIKSQDLFTDGVPSESRFVGFTKNGWAEFRTVNTVDSEGDVMRAEFFVHPHTREILNDWMYEEETGEKWGCSN